eukprot:1160877-Pelagomonas_calceolata.AAC.3
MVCPSSDAGTYQGLCRNCAMEAQENTSLIMSSSSNMQDNQTGSKNSCKKWKRLRRAGDHAWKRDSFKIAFHVPGMGLMAEVPGLQVVGMGFQLSGPQCFRSAALVGRYSDLILPEQ